MGNIVCKASVHNFYGRPIGDKSSTGPSPKAYMRAEKLRTGQSTQFRQVPIIKGIGDGLSTCLVMEVLSNQTVPVNPSDVLVSALH